MSSKGWLGKVSLVLATIVVSFAAQSGVSNPAGRDALWVVESQSVFKLPAVDSSIELEISSAEEVRAVAVDPVVGQVWVAKVGKLVSYGFDGALKLNIDLGKVELGSAILSVDPRDGNVWLARGNELKFFASDGRPIFTSDGGEISSTPTTKSISLAQPIVAISKYLPGYRVVASADAVWLQGESDSPPLYFFLAPSEELISDVSYDETNNDIWVSTDRSVRLLQHAANYNVAWEYSAGSDFRRIRLIDGGGAWIADENHLYLLSNSGQLVSSFAYDEPGELVDFVVDKIDGSLWVISHHYLYHYGSDGTFIDKILLADAGSGGRLWSMDLYVDDLPPNIHFSAPADGSLTNDPYLPFTLEYDDVGIGGDPSTIALTVNQSTAPFDCTELTEFSSQCTPATPLPEGNSAITATISDFHGAQSQPAEVGISLDTVLPVITVSSPEDGVIVTDSPITVSGQLSEPASLEVNGQAVTVDPSLGFSTDVGLVGGVNTIELVAADSAGNVSQLDLTVELQLPIELPPDPADVATTIDPSQPTTIYESTRFLYTGEDPIQKDADPLSISPRRVAVLRGRVLDRDGLPLPGVTVRAHGHPEFGTTLSRADGVFDLVVNGGGQVTVTYEKPGYLSVQRAIDTPWRDFRWLPDVVMTEFDDQVTHVDLTSTAPMQTARGSAVTDANGTRAATVMFPADVTAEMVLPDGSRQALSTLDVRATEYTVGPNGPDAMPGELPPTSAYTYAVELSVDEAVNAGAKSVEFSQPVPFYVENFLGFPVGIDVPTGYYDRDKVEWIPSTDGRIIQILDIVVGQAVLDVTGFGTPATSSELSALMITDEELAELALHYDIGDSLWRAPIPHFTPWDCNWPYTVPPDAEPPSEDVSDADPQEDDTTDCTGSIVECQNQVLGEEVEIAGTPYSLNYRSNRAPGRRAAYQLRIPVTDDTPPASLKRVEVEIGILGRQFAQTFSANPNQAWDFEWDGKDGYGRFPLGGQTASIFIDYVYDGIYVSTQEEFEQSFATIGDVERLLPGSSRNEVVMRRYITVPIGVWDARIQGLGGWTLNQHHAYEVARRQVFLGSGKTRRARNLNEIASRYAGHEDMLFVASGDDGPALEAGFNEVTDIVVGANGDLYIVDEDDNRVRVVDRETGEIRAVAGNGFGGGWDECAEYGCPREGPATETIIPNVNSVAIAPSGGIYVNYGRFDPWFHGLALVTPDGQLNVVYDVELDTETRFGDLAAADDGSVYFINGEAISRLNTNGQIELVAGDPDECGYSGDGGPANEARLCKPTEIALAPDDALYVVSRWNGVVRRILPNGVIETVAGIPGSYNYSGDGGPATEAEFRSPETLAIDRSGNLYIGDTWNHAVRKVKQDGTIVTVAGIGGPDWDNCYFPSAEEEEHCLEGTFARHFSIEWLHGLTVDEEDTLFIADNSKRQIWRIDRPFPEFRNEEIVVPAEDGTSLFVFSPDGKHQQTVDVVIGVTLYQFKYNPKGYLSTITDRHGNVTTIERDDVGTPLAVVGPFGQETTLTLDTNGYLATVANPLGETQSFEYQSGLIQHRQDAKGNVSSFSYDSNGRLVSDVDPVGGGWTMSREGLANSYEVTTSSGSGWDIKHRVEREDDGTWSQISTLPSGGTSMRLEDPSGKIQSTSVDDLILDSRLAPHPKLGSAVPYVAEATISLPDGQSLNLERSLQYVGDDGTAFGGHDIDDAVTVNGRAYRSHYDAATRTWTHTSPEGRTTRVQLNANGQAVSSQLDSLAAVSSQYDTLGRPVAITQGTRNLSLAYDGNGYLSQVVDAELRATTMDNDRVGRTQELHLPGERLVSFDFDANGNVTGITPPERPRHGFNYNGVDFATRYQPPAVGESDGAVVTDYRLDRTVGGVTRVDGGSVDLAYGAQSGLLTGIAAPFADYDYEYLPASDRLAGATGPAGQRLDYAWNGPLVDQVTWSGEISGQVGYAWDDNFWLDELTVNGQAIDYGYDDDGLVTGAGALALDYAPDVPLLEGTTLGPIQTMWTYNPFGEPRSYEAGLEDGPVLYRTEFTRDQLGRITEKVETIDSVETTFAYEYDPAGRLIEVREDGTVVDRYTYDANGNRLSHNGTTGIYDAQDRLLSYGDFDYAYTPDGQLRTRTDTATGETTHYTYDAFSNLTEVALPDGTEIAYVIDAQNRRIGKKVNGVLTQGFLYADQLNPVAELDGEGNIISIFVYASRLNVPDYMIRAGRIYRIVADHLGSVRLVIDTETGEVVQEMDYSAFGQVTKDTNPGFQPFGFAGGIYDRHTGLVRFGARDFNSEVGRWTAKEPLLFATGSQNLYLYAQGDPINFLDINGLELAVSAAGLALKSIPGLLNAKTYGEIAAHLGTATMNAGRKDYQNWKLLGIHAGELRGSLIDWREVDWSKYDQGNFEDTILCILNPETCDQDLDLCD